MKKHFWSDRKAKKLALSLSAILMAIAIPLSGCANTGTNEEESAIITDTPEKTFAQTSRGYSVAGQDCYVFSTSYGTFCGTYAGIINCDVAEEQTPLTIDDENIVLTDACAYNNNVLYMLESSDLNICKITITGQNTCEKEVWISYDELVKSPYIGNKTSVLCMQNWQYADGYIYFNIQSGQENVYDIYETDYTLCRINVNTKEISLVSSSIGVNTYVVHDNWIYYGSNGFDRNTPNTDEQGIVAPLETKYNKDYIGLYKMKPDGSENTKLTTFTVSENDDTPYYGQCAAYNLSVYNNYLYFWYGDYDAQSIQRCTLDGASLTTLTDNHGWLGLSFIIVPENNTLIYKFYDSESNMVGSVDLNTLETTETSTELTNPGNNNLFYHSGNIHIIRGASQGTKAAPVIYNIKFNVTDKKATAIYGYEVYKTVTNDFMGQTIEQSVFEKIVCFWQDYTATDKLFNLF